MLGILEVMRRLEIDWLKTIAGALAAVVSAVLLSTLGAAGTLIGAALGSLVVTVSSAAFTQGLATSRQTLTKAQAGAVEKVGIAQAEVQRAGRVDDTRARESHLDHAEERLAEANRELDEAASATPSATLGDRLSGLPWKRILLVSLGLFVAAVVAITAFELVAGRSVSSITGGSGDDERTTIGDVRGGDGRDDQGDRGDRDSPSEPATPTDEATPTGQPTPADETGDPPTDAPTESPTAPTETPTPADLSEQPDPSASP